MCIRDSPEPGDNPNISPAPTPIDIPITTVLYSYPLLHFSYLLPHFSYFLLHFSTQCQNPVMNVKLKITRFCNWLQSLRLYFWLEVFRKRMLILIGDRILLTNSDFQS